jgi:hypothetical protein
MKHVLDDLMGVRAHRERSAGMELRARKAECREAEEAETEKRKELADYGTWRRGKEETLFRRVANRLVRTGDLEAFRHKVRFLREKEAVLGEELAKAEEARRAAREKADGARDAYFLTVREKRKIEEHRNAWREERAREIERLDEREMEEYGKIPRGFDSGEEDEEDF